MISRRQLLLGSVGSALLAGCKPPSSLQLPPWLPVRIHYPGMATGHWLRDQSRQQAKPQSEARTDIVIIGSGMAALFAGWTLQREGHRHFRWITGPERFGNAAGGVWQGVRYPTGAHYLPLPSSESQHVSDLLEEMGVLQPGIDPRKPHFDETVLVHAPDERLLINGQWQEGLLPQTGIPAADRQEQQRFLQTIQSLKETRGRDHRRIFALPVAESSQDPEWRTLDKMTFAQWLDREHYTAPSLRWYLDYCCRDDYGADSHAISAFAGLHYFACRNGQAANADSNAVLTWEDGLNPLARHMAQACLPMEQTGMALKVQPIGKSIAVDYFPGPGYPLQRLLARKVILATPLHVSLRLLPPAYFPGLNQETLPGQASWLVSNLALNRFPNEQVGTELAWDNVIYGSQSLGYVVATHQWLRAAKPEHTIFTAYHALPFTGNHQQRHWLSQASLGDLQALALTDLSEAYGAGLWASAAHLDITVRGHAMAVPTPGYLNQRKKWGLDGDTGPIVLAHSDLSGYSVFEEASYWGRQAALRCLE